MRRAMGTPVGNLGAPRPEHARGIALADAGASLTTRTRGWRPDTATELGRTPAAIAFRRPLRLNAATGPDRFNNRAIFPRPPRMRWMGAWTRVGAGADHRRPDGRGAGWPNSAAGVVP